MKGIPTRIKCAMIVNLVRRQPLPECLTILRSIYYKTPCLYPFTSGVAVNIYYDIYFNQNVIHIKCSLK